MDKVTLQHTVKSLSIRQPEVRIKYPQPILERLVVAPNFILSSGGSEDPIQDWEEEEEEEVSITSGNWTGKHDSLSRGAGADQPWWLK